MPPHGQIVKSPGRQARDAKRRRNQEANWKRKNGPMISYKIGEEPPPMPPSIHGKPKHHPMSEAAAKFTRPGTEQIGERVPRALWEERLVEARKLKRKANQAKLPPPNPNNGDDLHAPWR